jgi:hypothetical protein
MVQGPQAAAYFFLSAFSAFTGLQSFFFLSDVAWHFLQAYLPGTSHSFGLSSRQLTVGKAPGNRPAPG